MDLINTGTDPWILEYEACKTLDRDIFEQLNLRKNVEVLSKEYDVLSARIRNRLKQYVVQVEQLKKKLKSAVTVGSITAEEHERRWRQIEVLQSHIFKLQDEFNKTNSSRYPASETNKAELNLLGNKNASNVFADMGTTSWGELNVGETSAKGNREIINQKTVEELKVDQWKMLKEQDEGLESLSKFISRQKEIATTINVEVDQQNALLDDLSEGMDRVEGRIQHETNMVRIIGKKDTTWGYWLVIFLLLIAIIGVSVA